MDTKKPDPVARASQRDELLQVALDFIGTLTGMSPPPIETAPPEVFGPFYAFVDRVQAITAPQVQADAPVVLPEPDAVLRFERSTAGKENEMPSVVSCNWLPDGEYKLYTEQQVRALLMHRKLND